jgi:hypothetical protein
VISIRSAALHRDKDITRLHAAGVILHTMNDCVGRWPGHQFYSTNGIGKLHHVILLCANRNGLSHLDESLLTG